MNVIDPNDFIITKKRKKYRFALFHNNPLCFECEEWKDQGPPQVLEVGAGTGLFSVSLAEAEPHTSHLAIDVKADRLQTGARLAHDKGLTNIRFLRARIGLLSEFIAPRSLEAVWITFPDPFKKDRMAKHRLTHSHFLEIYEAVLKPGSALYFKTDATALFDWSLEQLIEAGGILMRLVLIFTRQIFPIYTNKRLLMNPAT